MTKQPLTSVYTATEISIGAERVGFFYMFAEAATSTPTPKALQLKYNCWTVTMIQQSNRNLAIVVLSLKVHVMALESF